MNGITIRIFASPEGMSDTFIAAVRGPAAARRPRFTYKGTTFNLMRGKGDRPESIFVVLDSLAEPLPDVFNSGELQVERVTLTSEVPSVLRARAGWYEGSNFGFPNCICCVDPEDEQNNGRPQIHARGISLDDVVRFVRKVMSGDLKPGYSNNPWDRRKYTS